MVKSNMTKTEKSLQNLRRYDGIKNVLPSVKEYRNMAQVEKRYYQGKIRQFNNIQKARKNTAWKKVQKVKWFDEISQSDYVSRNDLKGASVNSIRNVRQLTQDKLYKKYENQYYDKKEKMWTKQHKVLKQDKSDFLREKIGGFGAKKEDLGHITEYNLIFGKSGVDYSKVNDQELSVQLNAIDYYKPIERNGVIVGYLDNDGRGRGSAHLFDEMPRGQEIKKILEEAGMF